MLFNTTAKRMSRFSIGAKKFNNSKKYLKEVNKSARALYKDIRNEATGGQWDTAAAYARSMRQEMKTQKKGFFTLAIRQSLKDSHTVNVISNYGRSVTKALRTGKLYRRESDMFEDMLNRSAFDSTSSYDIGAVKASNAGVDATYDSARATINSINSGTSAQLNMGKVAIAESKASSQRLNTLITASATAQTEKLDQIYRFQNDVLRNQIDEQIKLGRERNAILTEIRDLNKKMIINNDNYQQAAIENNKSFLELAFEGKWKDAFGKSVEEMMRSNQNLQNLNNVKRSGISMLGIMASNPLMFMKSMITESDTFKKMIGSGMNPKQLAGRAINRMGGSENGLLRFLGNSMIGSENETLSTVSVRTHVNRGAMQWNGDDHQALVEVIPTYLRKILSSLEGGQPELIYNYATNKFRTKADMQKQARELMNESVAGGGVGTSARKMTEWFKKKTNSQDSPDFVVLFDAFINDIARGGIGAIMDIKSILEWSYETYVKRYPNTAFKKNKEDLAQGENLTDVNKALRENYDMMRVAARSLIDSDSDFALEVAALENTIGSWRKRQLAAMKEIVEDSTGSGFSVFANGADRFEIKGASHGGGNGGPPPSFNERDLDLESRDLFKRQNSTMNIQSARAIVANLYNSDADTDKFFNRLSTISYEDFKMTGIALNVTSFKAWASKKYNNLSEEDKNALGTLFKSGKWDDIRAKLGIGEFDAYLMQIRDENIFDVNKATDGEKRKAKIHDDRTAKFNRFNNAYEGMHSSFGSIADDPKKRSAMASIITKVGAAAGLTAFAGGHGMIPFLSALGPHGVTIAALTATALGIAKNKDSLQDLLTSGMTDAQKADSKFVAKHMFSKLATGLGVAGVSGLGASLLGLPPVMIPMVMGAAGIAAGMVSEKTGFKKFFFGEGTEDKTFFELFRNKMLGDPNDESDDGLFGRAINPMIDGVKKLFTKMNEGIKKNIFGPIMGGMKKLVRKFDDSATGQQFNDLLGFSLSEFGGIMKKNVWEPLTGKLFGGLKSLLGFGRKHRDKAQEEMLNPYEQNADIAAQARAENATAGSGSSVARSNRGSRVKRSDFSIGGLSSFGGSSFTDLSEIRTSHAISTRDLKNLIGHDKSNPEKHYYSQKDPLYKDMKINLATDIEDDGCGVMAAAMVVSRMGRVRNDEPGEPKNEATPKWIETRLIPLAKKWTLPKVGTHMNFFSDVAKRFALESQVREGKVGYSMKELTKLTAGGKGAVVCLMKHKMFVNHYIVITGTNGDRVFYDDPARRRNLNMSYDELIEGAQQFIGFSKSKGIFGIIGKMFRGLIKVLDGSAMKERKAKQWGISRDYIDRMTKKEWDAVKNKRSISDELYHDLRTRTQKFKDSEGGLHDTWDKLLNKAQEKVGNASEAVNEKLDEEKILTKSERRKQKRAQKKAERKAKKAEKAGVINEAGSGTRKAKKSLADFNRQDTIPRKSTYPKGDRIPSLLSRKLVFKNDDEWKSLMFSATLNNTNVLGTMLAAIHTKLTELEVATFNGTNGVAYNVEHIKRATAIKNFGSMSEADKAVGPIDHSRLANPRFFRRGGVITRIKQGIVNLKDLVRSKTIDPIMAQYYIMKMTLTEWGTTLAEKLNPMKLVDGVKDFFTNTFDKAWGLLNNVAEGIGKGFKAVGTVIGGALKGIGSAIKGVVVGLGEAIGGIGKGIGEAIGGVVTGVIDIVKDIPKLLGDTLAGIGKAITTTMSGVVSVIGKVGGLGYRGVRRVVTDMWKGTSAVFGGIGRGAVAVKDFFSGKMNDTTKSGKRITYVRVLGGHIDTVGAVGAVDRDAYVKEWKANFRQVGGRSIETGRISGKSTVRAGKMYNDIDKEQDKVSEVQDKHTNLLETIAGNAGGGGSTTVVNENRGSMGWMDILKELTPTIMGLGYLLNKFMKKNEMTPGGNPMGPEAYKSVKDMVFSDANPFDIGHALNTGKWLGKKAISGINKITQPFRTAGRGIAKGYRAAKNGILKGGKNFKAVGDYISHTKLGGKLGLSTAEAGAVRSGQLVKSGDSFFKLGANGVIEKTAMVMDDAGKMVPEVTSFVDDVAKKSAEKAAQAAAKGAGKSPGFIGKMVNGLKSSADDLLKSWGVKAASYIKNMIIKTLQSNTVRKMFGEGIVDTLAKNVDNFAMKLVSSPAVKKGLMKSAGEVLSSLSKWVPVLNIAMFLYDLYAGWRDADKYFSVPEFKLTTKMRVAGSLTRSIQGLIAMIPWLMPIAFIPTEWFVSAVWAMIGTDAEKKELEATKAEYGKRYDAYKKSMESSGKKPKTYDDWVREVGDNDKNQKKMEKYGGVGFVDNTNKQLQKTNAKDSNFGAKTAGYAGVWNGYTNTGNGYGAGNTVYGAGAGGSIFRADTAGTGAGLGIPGSGAVPTTGGSSVKSFTIQDYDALRALLGKVHNPLDKMEVTSHALIFRKSSGRPHKGTDFAASTGTSVYAIGPGTATVSYAPFKKAANYGHYIVINHGNGYISRYAHLSKVLVKTGDKVKGGQLIGKTGFSGMSPGDKTGAQHLHFELRKGTDPSSPVGNAERFLSISNVRKGIETGAVFGAGMTGSYGRTEKPGNIDSMYTKMYSQNSEFNMGVGGDGMSLQQVGCGPVTTNLFLQDAGVREPLLKTLKALKNRRKKNDGFSPEILSSYITSRGIGNKVIKPSKAEISKASYGIAFATRNSAINSLDENHALYIKHINAQGVILYDPYYETTKYSNWDMFLKSIFNVIIPSTKSDIMSTVRGGTESALIEAGRIAKVDSGNPYKTVLNTARQMRAEKKRIQKAMEDSNKATNKEIVRVEEKYTPKATNDNIMVDVIKEMSNKMDIMIQLLAKMAEGNVTKQEVRNGVSATLQKMMDSLQNNTTTSSGGTDAWLANRNHISKGGI